MPAQQCDWATDEWFAAVVHSSHERLPAIPGAHLVTQHVITGTPLGTVKYVEEKHDGRATHLYLGECGTADLTVTMAYEDYRHIFEQLTTSDRIPAVQVQGDPKLLEPFLPTRRSAAFREHTRHLHAITRWPH